ncbi:PepSY domain-containing protein [Companilactobacillus kimchiensis]|nr:PepSY domain-containing protein [Companilactobacillus kimchiensis]
MKKYLFSLGISLLTIFILTGCTSSNSTSNKSKPSGSTELVNNTKISVNKAAEIYQKEFSNAKMNSVELQQHLGKPIYTIEGFDNKYEYEMTINALNKKIIHKSHENLDQDDLVELQNEQLDLSKVISLNEAAKIAKKSAKTGKATEFQLKKEHGNTFWEVTIKNKSSEKEITINALDGNITKIEND